MMNKSGFSIFTLGRVPTTLRKWSITAFLTVNELKCECDNDGETPLPKIQSLLMVWYSGLIIFDQLICDAISYKSSEDDIPVCMEYNDSHNNMYI